MHAEVCLGRTYAHSLRRAALQVPALRIHNKTESGPCDTSQVHAYGSAPKEKREEDVAQIFDRNTIRYSREFSISFSGQARKYARLDFLLEVGFGWVIFEVDERQHSQYEVSYECQRMALVFAEFIKRCEGKKLHIIRYNPDPYKDSHGLVVKPTPEEREGEIRRAIQYVPEEARFTITYLFYRLRDGLPEITYDAEYSLREHVRRQGP